MSIYATVAVSNWFEFEEANGTGFYWECCDTVEALLSRCRNA